MPSTSPSAYSATQKILHWAVVVLLALQYFAFDSIGRSFHTLMQEGTRVYSFVTVAHIVVGIAVFVLMGWRLALRLSHGVPDLPAEEPGWAGLAAKLTHAALYLLLVLLPISGLSAWALASGGLAQLHEAGTNLLMLLVILHVGAVVVHQFWWKTNLARRMM